MPPGRTLPRIIGADVKVPLTTGGFATYANLDYAATAPCLESVWIAVDEALAQYSSVHRGSGYLSRVTSELYERAREVLRDFVGAGPEHSVIFTLNTTDAGPAHARDAVDLAVPALRDSRPCLLAVTAASNVTGEVWPVAQLAHAAHAHGARILVDASDHHGIGVRFGKFCAHMFVRQLLGADDGAGCDAAAVGPIRASFGIGTTAEHIDRLIGALQALSSH